MHTMILTIHLYLLTYTHSYILTYKQSYILHKLIHIDTPIITCTQCTQLYKLMHTIHTYLLHLTHTMHTYAHIHLLMRVKTCIHAF